MAQTVVGRHRKNTDLDIILTLKDGAGAVANLATLDDDPVVQLGPGSGFPAVATLDAVVVSAADGTVKVSINAADLLSIQAGRYEFYVTGTAGGRPLDFAREYLIDLIDGPGTATLTPGWTRAKLERTLVRRMSAALGAADLRILSAGGNDCLADPILAALDHLGIIPTDPGEPCDLDLAAVAPSSSRALVDIALYETMRSVEMGYIQVGWASESSRQDLGQFGVRAAKQGDRMQAFVLARYGYGRPRSGGPAFGTRADVTVAENVATVPLPVYYDAYGYPIERG